jgi:membrane-bound lytic murein transglycosylase D
MMKSSMLALYLILTVFLFSCAQAKRPNKSSLKNHSAAYELKEDEVNEKRGADNHELADADADDTDIKKEIGVSDLDDELPDSESDKVPYARNFLIKKNTKRMQFWVDYFTKKQRDRFQRFINNGEEYRHHIEKVFEEYGLPKELYFVGLIESGYYLGARSHASAVGPWQFIKGTGSRYGLKITPELDERQDLFKASRAAAMYFKDLHNVFSSWELALSAYNAGEYGIIRRIMKHGTRDFYELSKNKQLPSETINYVPKVLAAMHVVNNAEKYGFIIPKKKHRLFDLTELTPAKKNVSLKTIAARLNVSEELLRKLNPELKQASTPRQFSGTYFLRVPTGKYAKSIAPDVIEPQIPKTAVVFEKPESKRELIRRVAEVKKTEIQPPALHTVKSGETLLSISRKYKLTPRSIAEANNLSSWRSRVQAGQILKLTLNNEERRTVASIPKVKVLNKPIVYQVKAGDNLTDLARLFNQNVKKIKTANNLKREKIVVGQKIILPDTQKGIYTVKAGDHLTKVAKDLNRPMEALIKLNSLSRKKIYPGQKIIVNMD